MLRHQLTVLTKDSRLKREVQRITASTGSHAEFGADLSVLDAERKPDLMIVDARTDKPPSGLKAKLPDGCPTIYIVDEERMTEGLSHFEDGHTVSLMGYGARFDDDEFIASATKALRGNVFGLNKYFPWGVTTYSVVVKNYQEKSRAIDAVLHYATLAGVRSQVRERIQTVADELMMNGLYHAPVDAQGKEKYANIPIKDLAKLEEVSPIEVSYGSSGRYFGISVRDGGGSLTRQRAMQYLGKANSATVDIETKVGGAGLGLVSVLRSVSKLVFNLEPGKSTEVIGLFDIELFAKGKVGARSVHVFTSRTATDTSSDGAADVDPTPDLRTGRRSLWLVAALLLSVATALGTVLVMRGSNQASAATQRDQCPPTSSGSAADDSPSSARSTPASPVPARGTTVRAHGPRPATVHGDNPASR